MSDYEGEEECDGKLFCVERAKKGRAKCKKCKQGCVSGEIRIAKLTYNPFSSGKMKQWHHLSCLFEQFLAQRLTTKRIENCEEVYGYDDLDQDDKDEVNKCIEESEKNIAKKYGNKYSTKKPAEKPIKKKTSQQNKDKDDEATVSQVNDSEENRDHKDNSFRQFRRLVADITNESSYLEKSALVKNLFTKGSDGKGFKGDVILWCKLLLPGVIKRIYNLQSKQLVKLFSDMFETDKDEMLEHLEQGDIGETIQHFFENSNGIKPSKKSKLNIFDVDEFLEELAKRTKEDEQIDHFKKMLKKCTTNDLKVIIRLIKHDLRMNAGAKHILEGVDSNAYESFQASRDITKVLKQFLDKNDRLATKDKNKQVKVSIDVMTPVLPMLAEACKSVEQAMKKCPNGMYSEIKYDGERVQVHKHGDDFKYYSRSLKPVLPHKVKHFEKYIPEAFPLAKDLILDSEVLLIDTTNGKPLPFGSLGKHKKHEFKDANVCLFVFDCLYYNGESLMQKPIKERRKILNENMKEIPNHVMFSEMEEVDKAEDLAAMIAKVLKLGLEGLVLKDQMSIYEPGKRHWLKVKKDYLCDGAMADSADLIVLGAWFGTGKKGGMMSVFLMGCYDKYKNKFCTVTKVHTGHDDKTLERLQSELDMVKISCEVNKVPDWLKCSRSMVPDFVAKDPKKQPVWEITGAEFTQHEVHTADGISIRFPRVTRIRSDKTWETATNLKELKVMFKNSNENIDYSKLLNVENKDEESDTPSGSKKSPNIGRKSPLPDVKKEEIDRKNKGKHVSDEDSDTPSCSKKSPNIERKSSSPDVVKKEETDRKKKRKHVSDEDSDTLSSSKKSLNIERKSPLPDVKKEETDRMKKRKHVSDEDSDTSSGSKKSPNIERKSSSPEVVKKEETDRKRKRKHVSEELDVPSTSTNIDKLEKETDEIPKKRTKKGEMEIRYPDLFANINILPQDEVKENCKDLLRYFIAFGGNVLNGDSEEPANYIVHENDTASNISTTDFPISARHITADWIKDCIGNKELQNPKPYAVKLLPG